MLDTTQNHNLEKTSTPQESKTNPLKKVLGKSLLESLSSEEKDELFLQIKDLEKDNLLSNGVKLRVNPTMINLVRKLTGVHDIKGGAYRGDTMYLATPDDLYNKDLINHENIHVEQQAEGSKIKFIGFVKWLLAAAKGMNEYKKQYGDRKDVNYESTIMIPTELEAYDNAPQYDYLKNRKKGAVEQYKTPQKKQEVMEKIESRNYTIVKEELEGKGAFRDLERMDEIMQKTKDSEWTMYIFNNVDEVNGLTGLQSVFEKKLEILDVSPESLSYKKLLSEYEKLRKKYVRYAYKFNLHSFLEDDFKDPDVIKKTLEEISFNITKYKRAPAKFRLEDINQKDKIIEMGL